MSFWKKFLCCVGVKSAPEDAVGSAASKQRKKSPSDRPDAGTAAAGSARSSSAWDLYDNTGPQQPTAETAQPSTVQQQPPPPSPQTSTSSQSPSLQGNGGSLNLFLGRQQKSVRFDDVQEAPGSNGVGLGIGGGKGGGNGTPDSFYDDLKNLDYAVVPTDVIAPPISAPNYDELPSQAELRARDSGADYALPPALPVASTDGDYDYSLGGSAESGCSDYQNVNVATAAAAATASVGSSSESPKQRKPQQQQQQQQHRITQEFLDDLLASPAGGRDSGSVSDLLLESDKRSLMSNTESIDSEDIAFRPDCQLRLQLSDAVDRLRKLETDFSERCSRLYKFIHSRWKAEASLALNMSSLRPTVTELNELLTRLVEFHYGVLNNARLEACPDRALCKKVWKHLRVFERNALEFADAVAGIQRLDWKPRLIADACSEPATDYLGFCVSSARDLQIQQRALSTAVHANAPLLFPTDVIDQLDERVIPIETADWRHQQQQQMQRLSLASSRSSGSQNQHQTAQQQQHQGPADYMRMSLLTDATTGLPSGDRELLAVYSDRLRTGSEVYAVMCQDLQVALSSRQSSGTVIGGLCRSLVSRAYKLSQIAAMLHEGLHSVQLKSSIEQLISQLGHQLKAILRTSKAVMETAPAEWQQQLAGQLARYIADSLSLVRELSQLVAQRAAAGVS